jgi:hypothetical protein
MGLETLEAGRNCEKLARQMVVRGWEVKRGEIVACCAKVLQVIPLTLMVISCRVCGQPVKSREGKDCDRYLGRCEGLQGLEVCDFRRVKCVGLETAELHN